MRFRRKDGVGGAGRWNEVMEWMGGSEDNEVIKRRMHVVEGWKTRGLCETGDQSMRLSRISVRRIESKLKNQHPPYIHGGV